MQGKKAVLLELVFASYRCDGKHPSSRLVTSVCLQLVNIQGTVVLVVVLACLKYIFNSNCYKWVI